MSQYLGSWASTLFLGCQVTFWPTRQQLKLSIPAPPATSGQGAGWVRFPKRQSKPALRPARARVPGRPTRHVCILIGEGVQSDDKEEEGELVDSFNTEDKDNSNSEEEDEADGPKHKEGELAEGNELSSDDIQDLEENDNKDAYTSASCCQTLAKARLYGNVIHNTATPRKSHLNQANFDLARDLVQILETFYECTPLFKENRYPPALQNACRAGMLITNKYYLLTDNSPIYQIAMVLHPSFKMAKWPESWIDEAINLTRDMYSTWHKPKQPTCAMDEAAKRLGAAAVARAAGATADPIEIWLSGGLVWDKGAPVNGLKWWAKQKRGGNTPNGLLQMALDVMCCPATTVDVERTFNFG
ncbi:hypothetical protein PSHT_15481 [Puccinia striiformis]|uniref:HAT C-terminal dimerisation domain-containing protein n=1 Tax=Puccinia striiformis TaxID=27350 RepID=A0A2S4UEU8_9BASI|nr:hypothetical protein PSHT_15481 [Puccinia striiformis]